MSTTHTSGEWYEMGLANLVPGDKLVRIEEHGFGVVCAIVDYEGESIYRICQAMNCHRDLLTACKELALRTEQFLLGKLVSFPAALLPQVKAVIAKAEDSLAVRGAVQEQLQCE